ncbi:spore cortex-lytic enzyme [Priestia koreensis]|nr:spore cortex-lytic enzyme [Priestia koreensis]MCM3003939.1 spore cortex-lytic enzyme [Priestia koreensis]UNL87328.1 spore cortex-lytic enzyme [Priestia koreensis]
MVMTALFSILPTGNEARAFSNQVIQHGAVGDDVIELQSRLQYVGFYNGKIDGVFGWSTYWALRNFQYEFGMKVDGLGGLKTRQKLVSVTQYQEQYVKKEMHKGKKFKYYGQSGKGGQSAPSKGNSSGNNNSGKQQANNNQSGGKKEAPKQKQSAVNVPSGFTQNDIKLISNAVYGESRGEPYVGQVAVAAVILNRMDSANFPDTVAGVIFEPGAFTAVADGQIWLEPNQQAEKAVIDAINGWDPTGDALYYFNPNTATSAWIWSRPQIKQIGKHIFCK